MNRNDIQKKVPKIGGQAVKEKGYACAVDIFVGLGWLDKRRIDAWYKGECPNLERVVGANLNKISFAMKQFRAWAKKSNLSPSLTVYKQRGRKRKGLLKFSKSGKPSIEEAYSTHYVTRKKREGVLEKRNRESYENARKKDKERKEQREIPLSQEEFDEIVLDIVLGK